MRERRRISHSDDDDDAAGGGGYAEEPHTFTVPFPSGLDAFPPTAADAGVRRGGVTEGPPSTQDADEAERRLLAALSARRPALPRRRPLAMSIDDLDP
jgi:hypothetical protein